MIHYFMFLPLLFGAWGCLVVVFVCINEFFNLLDEEERTGCFTKMALPRIGVG